MAFEYDMWLYCACGNAAQILAEQVPAAWGDQPANIPSEIWARFRCSACGRRGKPRQITIAPLTNRNRGGSYPTFGE